MSCVDHLRNGVLQLIDHEVFYSINHDFCIKIMNLRRSLKFFDRDSSGMIDYLEFQVRF